jgi:membrane-bound lytic murein transglycosylase MltF
MKSRDGLSRIPLAVLILLVMAPLVNMACSDRAASAPPAPVTGSAPAPATAPAATGQPASAPVDEPLPPLEFEKVLPPSVAAVIGEAFFGDLDGMVKRRLVRVGITFNRTHYFVDNGVQRGAAYEYFRLFEDRLNEVLKTANLRIHLVFVPMSRDKMFQALRDGLIDVAEGQFTITPERRALGDFSTPVRRNVSEIVVTGPGATRLNTTDDLSGREVFVRRSSSYYQSLQALNTRFESEGRAPIIIDDAPENLEDDDLLEMVNASLVDTIIVDDYLASLWAKVFPRITLHRAATLRTGGEIAVAFRKNSPLLEDALNAFIRRWGLGTAFGNAIAKRYLQSTRFAMTATVEAERRKFEGLLRFFRQYGKRYDLDEILMAAQGYQESRLDQSARSHVGAIGVMQVMPATGAELNVGDIHQVEPNIHAGVKYIRQIIANHLDGSISDLDRSLLAFACYNAGPGRIRQLRRETARRGLDPNVWFGNVEQVVSERIGRETVTYVSNIFKYYVAYKLVLHQQERRDALRRASNSH